MLGSPCRLLAAAHLPSHPLHAPPHPANPVARHLPTCPLAHLLTCPPAHLPTLQIMSIKASHSGRLTDYKSDTCTYMEGCARAWHSLGVVVVGGWCKGELSESSTETSLRQLQPPTAAARHDAAPTVRCSLSQSQALGD